MSKQLLSEVQEFILNSSFLIEDTYELISSNRNGLYCNTSIVIKEDILKSLQNDTYIVYCPSIFTQNYLSSVYLGICRYEHDCDDCVNEMCATKVEYNDKRRSLLPSLKYYTSLSETIESIMGLATPKFVTYIKAREILS